SVLVARLDCDPPVSRTASLEVELERVHNGLTLMAEPRHRPDSERECLLARCERMRGVLLERRIRTELGRSTVGATPEQLLTLRLEHSRLQARVSALESTNDGDGHPLWLGGDPAEWAGALSLRRIELADRAGAQLQEEADENQARERIGRQVRELERLQRTVRGEWQEKLLALRLENLLGPRFVKAI